MSTAAVTPQPEQQYQNVNLPDGRTARFPSGMSHGDIEGVLQKQFPPQAAKEQPKEEAHGFVNTLGREAKSAGASILGMPSAIYHSFKDPITPEEQGELTKYGGPKENRNPGSFGLGMARMGVLPVARAAEDYYGAAIGEKPGMGENALDIAPEAIGGAGGAMLGAKLAEAAPGAIRTGAPALVRGVAKGTNAVLGKAPGSIGAAAGGALGHATGVPYAGTAGAGLGYALGKELLPQLRVPGEDFGLPKPVYPGAHLPASQEVMEGEYLDAHPQAPVKPQAPFTPALEVRKPALPENASETMWRSQGHSLQPGPRFRPDMALPERGQGIQLPERMPEPVADEAPAQMIGSQASEPEIPVTYPEQELGELGDRPWGGSTSATGEVPRTAPELERHGQNAISQERHTFADRNSMDKPKWLRNAEFKAQQVLDQAEQEHTNPLRGLPNVSRGKTPAYTPVGEPFGMPDDLSETLKESIRQVQAKKKPKL